MSIFLNKQVCIRSTGFLLSILFCRALENGLLVLKVWLWSKAALLYAVPDGFLNSSILLIVFDHYELYERLSLPLLLTFIWY